MAEIAGLDVSKWQGPAIRWAEVAKVGYRFAVLRSSSGTTFDATYAGNRDRARAAGILTGPYHYVTPGATPEAQAAALLATIGPATFDELPVALDVEGDWTTNPGPVVARIARLVEATGRRVIVYTYPNFAARWKLAELVGWPLWIADYNRALPAPRFAPWPGFAVHQYGGGPIPGIAGNVDKDRLGDVDRDGDIDDYDLVKLTHAPLATWAALEAAKHIHEDPPGSNHTPYAARAGFPSLDRQPWCALFCTAGARETATGGVPASAGVRAMHDKAIKLGTWHEGLGGLRAGDVVIRWRPGGGHVEVALGPVVNGHFPSTGGNTSGAPGVDWNGGAVVRQDRTVAGWVGYIRPTRCSIGPGPLPKPAPTPTKGDTVGIVLRLPDGRIGEVTRLEFRHIGTPAEVVALLGAGGAPQTDATADLAARVVVTG